MVSPSSASPDGLGGRRSQPPQSAYAGVLEMLRDSPDAAVSVDPAGRIAFWNDQAQRMFGWTAEEMLGRPLDDTLVPERNQEDSHPWLRMAQAKGAERRFEMEALRKDGSELAIEVSITSLSNNPPTFAAFIRDISEQRAVEADRARLAAQVESSPQSMLVVDLAGKVIGWSGGAAAMTGYSEQEAIGRDVAFLTAPGHEHENLEFIQTLTRGESVVGYDTQSLRKDGSVVDIAISVYPVRDATGRITAVASTSLDITDRKRAEADILASGARFKRLFDLLPVPAILTSVPDGTIVEANQAFFEVTGLAPHTAYAREGSGWLVLDGKGQELAKEFAREGYVDRREVTVRIAGGGTGTFLASGVSMEVDGQPAGLWIAEDITHQRELEEQVLHSANLEVAGRVAAGLAHDFNNLLSVMLGQADIMLTQVEPNTEIHDSLTKVRSAALAAAGLTSQLMAIGGRQPLSLVTVQLNELIDEMRGLLLATLGGQLTYAADLPHNLWAIRADPVQFERVLMNLIVNAKDAMSGDDKLTISCANVTVAEGVPGDVPAGDYVEMRVADNGSGMDRETLTNLFEPYYTKKAGGTGLGLATVRGIVTQSGGHINVSSELGQGTEFRLLFPRLESSQG